MSSFSNAGQQTRGLSAADWTRLQRLRGARTSGYSYGSYSGDLTTNVDLAPTEAAQIPHGKALLIPYEAAGTTRMLRPASKWTDFVAAGRADFVTQSRARAPDGTILNGSTLSVTTLCNCTTTTLTTRVGLCKQCKAPKHSVTSATTAPYTGPNPAIHLTTIFKVVK